MAATHRLDATVVHHEWNNAIPPRLRVEPGDTPEDFARSMPDQDHAAALFLVLNALDPGQGRSGSTGRA